MQTENEWLKRQIATLKEVNETIVVDLNLEEVTQKIVDSIVELFGYLGGTLFLANQKSGTVYSHTVSNTRLIKRAVEKLDKPITEHTTPIIDPENLIGRTVAEGKSFRSVQLSDFIVPTVSARTADVIQRMTRMKLTISYPLKYGSKTIGAWMFHVKKSSLSEEENKLMQLFSDQISIAIYNARLYSRVQDQVEELDAKTKDLGSLLTVTQQAIRSLEPNEVAQNIVNAVPEKLKHLEFVAGLIVDYDMKSSKVVPRTITRVPITEKALDIIGKPLNEFTQQLDLANPSTLIGRSIVTREIQMSDELEEFVAPYVPKRAARAAQKAMNVGTIISVPMVVRGEVVGAFVFFANRNPHTITDRERDLMMAFANNMGLAIENARLYKIIEEKAEELEEKNEYLKRLDETKSNFLSITSHQLRTPISGIKGYLSMLAEGDFGKLETKQQEIVDMNLLNVERLVKLIDMFLNVSRIEAGRLNLEKAPTDMMAMIEDVVRTLGQEAERKGLTLSVEKPNRKLPNPVIDEEKMRQVVLNLVDNASKYTKEGGITIIPSATRKVFKIEVRDTGIGLDEADAQQLFGKFVRAGGGAKINANGSGLGLFIIKKIVEAHGGRVWVESDGVGRGSSFFVEIPLRAETAKAEETA
ncbi:MAG: GAF domain-containing protein [Candidatus Doudnabacteria bacterium]|nr:GAF domain-containing protein [Candidatus Doudnabacteria bacterium]